MFLLMLSKVGEGE